MNYDLYLDFFEEVLEEKDYSKYYVYGVIPLILTGAMVFYKMVAFLDVDQKID
jgi:hypothetical protein